MSDDQVREASDRFYSILLKGMQTGDISQMDDVWSHGSDVSTMHPLGGQQVGWNNVREAWQLAAQSIGDASVSVSDLRVVMLGDTAFTTGVEHATARVGSTPVSFNCRCTNIYRRENGDWKMVHHHTDLSPEAAAAIQSLMAQGS